ncbi:MAG: 50S ribosomal protein L23 [Bacilli bacterium]|nr:50S ribosomal protein L23 [Bacilli bacterium]
MADEIKAAEAVVEEAPKKKAPAKKAAPKKAAAKKEAPAEAPVEEAKPKKAAKKAPAKKAEEAPKKNFPKPTVHDFEVIDAPHITEKTMALMQNANKVTVKVHASANKIEIKNAFERVFQVKVVDVKVLNQRAKSTTRGGRYAGKISGFKKAVVTIADGEALDLFKE